MPAHSLQNLAEQFCSVVGLPTPDLTADDDGVFAFSAEVSGVHFSVTHEPLRNPDDVMVLVFFGLVSPDHEVFVLRELLHANLRIRKRNAPAFSRNPLTGSIVIQFCISLADSSGERLWEGIQPVIQSVLRWRRDYSLHDFQAASMPAFDASPAQLA